MTENTPNPLGDVISIDDERIKSHLDRVIRGTVEETLNALLDAEADRLCNARRMSTVSARYAAPTRNEIGSARLVSRIAYCTNKD